MRTPISTMLFFLLMVIKILQTVPSDPDEISQGIKYCQILV